MFFSNLKSSSLHILTIRGFCAFLNILALVVLPTPLHVVNLDDTTCLALVT
jgi:hypothetical protein